MNLDPLLDKAETAMLECTDHSAYRYWICELHGKLVCIPALSVPEDATLIYPLSRHDLLFGPDQTGWTVMRDELTKHERSKS